ncbi:MAG: diaminopimelate epimerase [Propionibacteriaceae bacterium]|jgi:diaminopimelate epimerase|nr:diaminopimelate epimerase [Propionibacteriaceae bacterium]
MKFTKMQGAGNDYVYVNCFAQTVSKPSELARRVADRHFGIGGDGLVLIGRSSSADFSMRMYNADGSEAEMCGNAIRCVGKFVYERGLTGKSTITVETLAGIKTLDLAIKNDRVARVTVDMGEPELRPAYIPVRFDGPEVTNRPITVGGEHYAVTCVSMGNPHAVVFLDQIDALNLPRLGPKFEYHELFPDRINTEFVELTREDDHLRLRVWERGSGETLACGTGTCAAVVASVLGGYTGRSVAVSLRGGELHVRWDESNNHVYLTGGAEFVFEAEMDV